MSFTANKMNQTKLLIEILDNKQMDAIVKGERHLVISMIVEAMERVPEVREAILFGAKEFLSKNKFNIHL